MSETFAQAVTLGVVNFDMVQCIMHSTKLLKSTDFILGINTNVQSDTT